MKQIDASDIVSIVGALLVALGIYLQFGGAWSIVFVGLILMVLGLMGVLASARRNGSDQ